MTEVQAPSPAKGNVPALTGIRAIAIIAVMIFHLGALPIGWVGVPLFFVLSGYLITSILASHRDENLRSYLGRFYWNRTIRIFPLYYAYLAINAALVIGLGKSLDGYGYFVTYLGNYRIGALAPEVPGGLVGHLWSLAVEEQFYLLWPFAIFFARRWAWIVAVLAIIAAPIAREVIHASTGNPYMTIVTLPSCIDMLGAGALVALVRRRELLLGMASLGIAILAYCFATVPFGDFALTPLWAPQAHIMYTGLALAFAPLIVVAHNIRALAWAPLVWIGRISYGLYLWHLLAFAAAQKLHLGPVAEGALGSALSFSIATVSWIFFEKPILSLKDPEVRRGLFNSRRVIGDKAVGR